MPIETYALILLFLRVIAIAIILRVVAIQVPLLRATDYPHLLVLRIVMLAMSLALLVSNVIPAYIDYQTIFGLIERSAKFLSDATLVYGFSNAITSLIAAIVLRMIYQVSHKTPVTTDK